MSRQPADPLTALKNIGPDSAAKLRAVGIATPENLRRLGVPMAWRILRHRFPTVGVLFLRALEGAVQDRHWNSFSAEEKAALREAAEGVLVVGT